MHCISQPLMAQLEKLQVECDFCSILISVFSCSLGLSYSETESLYLYSFHEILGAWQGLLHICYKQVASLHLNPSASILPIKCLTKLLDKLSWLMFHTRLHMWTMLPLIPSLKSKTSAPHRT